MAPPKWLQTLIDDPFLPALRELADDEQGHAQAQQWADWMRDRWAQHGLTALKQQRNLMTAVRNAIKQQLGTDHFTLDYVNFTTAEWTEMNQSISDQVSDRNEHQQFLENPQAIVDRAVRLLYDSKEWADIAAALVVLTGRRSSEILATAQFEWKSQWSVIFTGALKRHGESQQLSFEIPTLTTAKRVIDGLETLRSWVHVQGLTNEQVNQKYGDAVARACDRHFRDLVPTREGKENLYTHLFRSVYATIATYWYCPPTVDANEFKAQIQGHFQILDEANPKTRRSIMAGRHYNDFKISDGKGNIDGRQGIKLGYGGVEVIDVFKPKEKMLDQVVQDAAMALEAMPERPKLTSIKVLKQERDRWQAVLDQIAPDQPSSIQQMSTLLQWVEARLQLEMQAVQGEPAAEEQIEAETHLEPEPVALEAAVEQQAEGESAAVPVAPIQLSREEQAWAKIDRLADLLTQLTQQMGQQTGGIKPERKTTRLTPKTPSDDAVPRRSSEGAEAKVNQAIDTIMRFNQGQERREDKWAIGISALKKLTKVYQGVINRVLDTRKDEIERHHHQHGIGQHHNLLHRGKKIITDDIQI